MIRLVFPVVLALGFLRQESDTVRALVESISDRDPAASFLAISRLVDLPASHGAEILKAADRLPAFYREVLISELTARRELGPRFGSGTRIQLKGIGRTARKHLDEIGRLTGMKIHVEGLTDRAAGQRFDVDLED